MNIGAAGGLVAEIGDFRLGGGEEIFYLLFLVIGEIELVERLLDVSETTTGVLATGGRPGGGWWGGGRLIGGCLAGVLLAGVLLTAISLAAVSLAQAGAQFLIERFHLVICQDAGQILVDLFVEAGQE